MTPILEAKHLVKTFATTGRQLFPSKGFTAVRDVSFSVMPGEIFGIVGESGSGKSTVARMLMCLEPLTEGEVHFDGNRIDNMSPQKLRSLRPQFQMVFQDSGTTLNPRKRIGDILREPMLHHGICPPEEIDERIDTLLADVGLGTNVRNRYPHEFSGGQRQRICIARALSLSPRLLILDEPVSALDVSIQAQILNLLQELQEKNNLTYLFISHGLGAVRYISHRIAVMYRGEIVETGNCEDIFSHPAHPYTRALIDAVPSVETSIRPKMMLQGEINDSIREGTCPLLHRCPMAGPRCSSYTGEPITLSEPSHISLCTRALEDTADA